MTDTAQVSLVNRTLFLLGQDPVPDLSDAALAGSIAAVKVMAAVEDARDAVLARHGWTSALAYASLPPAVLAGYVNFRYPVVFQLPGGALHVWEVDGERCARDPLAPPETRWQVGTFETGAGSRLIIRAADTWWTSRALDQLNVAYVRRCAWTAMDPQLKEAVALECAARAAWNVTGSGELMGRLQAQAEAKVLLAISGDGNQEGGQPPLMASIPAALRARSR